MGAKETLCSCPQGGYSYEVVSAIAYNASVEVADLVKDWDTRHLVAVCAAGFAAQLVDGSLGMGYGVTSSTVLVLSGLSPATASASVHLAQLGTTALSGLAHRRFGNVDDPIMWSLSLPGIVGAFVGATILSALSGATAKTMTAFLLFAMGVRILAKGGKVHKTSAEGGRPPLSLLLPLGLIGGFVDATGGGGWGPVATSGLLADGRLPPKTTIGTVYAPALSLLPNPHNRPTRTTTRPTPPVARPPRRRRARVRCQLLTLTSL